MLIRELFETASAGSTSAGSIATVASPHLAIGNDKTRKKFGKGGSPKPPTVTVAKNSDGTTKNAVDMPNNIFGNGAVKR